MKYFFEDVEKQKELKIILDSWLGTRFRHRCGIKYLGTDCIHFVARVLQEMKILGEIKIPDYAPDWHIHKTNQLLVNSILKYLKVEDVGFEDLMNGDIVLYFFGKAAAHAGIYYDNHIYQAVNDIGVLSIQFHDQMWNKHKQYNFRILA